jgi:ABC-type dipeptide/oligopeptide/nickel transport system ATPase component
VHSGEVMGLMGASGAGKTSLMAILSRQPHLLPKSSKPYGSVKLLLDNTDPSPSASPEGDLTSAMEPSAAPSHCHSQDMSNHGSIASVSTVQRARRSPGPVRCETKDFADVIQLSQLPSFCSLHAMQHHESSQQSIVIYSGE